VLVLCCREVHHPIFDVSPDISYRPIRYPILAKCIGTADTPFPRAQDDYTLTTSFTTGFWDANMASEHLMGLCKKKTRLACDSSHMFVDMMQKRRKTGPTEASAEGARSSSSPKLYFAVTKCHYKTVDELYGAVLKAQSRGSAKYWKKVTVVKQDATVVLECEECGKQLSSRNPADSCSNHFFTREGNMVCKKASRLRDEAGEAPDAAPDAAPAVASSSGKLSATYACFRSDTGPF
jgi:hypothetical protein